MSFVSPKNPVYIFHHIPKCGGTSVNKVLNHWFLIIRDYRSPLSLNYKDKIDLNNLRSCHCLCGHFELNGYHIHQRYPQAIEEERYRIITFVRDPLQIQLSLYRYERKRNTPIAKNIEEHLFLRPNYLSNRLPATINTTA